MLKTCSKIKAQMWIVIFTTSFMALAGCSKKKDDDQSVAPSVAPEAAQTTQTSQGSPEEIPQPLAEEPLEGDELPRAQDETPIAGETPTIGDSLAAGDSSPEAENPPVDAGGARCIPPNIANSLPEAGGGAPNVPATPIEPQIVPVPTPEPGTTPNPITASTTAGEPNGNPGSAIGDSNARPAGSTPANDRTPQSNSDVTQAGTTGSTPGSTPVTTVVGGAPADTIPAVTVPQPVQEPLRFESGYGCVLNDNASGQRFQVAANDQRNPLIKLNAETSQPESFLPCSAVSNSDLSSQLTAETVRLSGSLAGLNYNADIEIHRTSRRRNLQNIARYFFRDRDLRWANLSGLKGSGIEFRAANLMNASLPSLCVNCNFSRSRLSSARAWRIDVDPNNPNTMERFEMNFTGSNFSNADLRRLVFYSGTNLSNANFQCAKFDVNTFPRAGAQLQGARFSEVSIRRAVRTDADFEELKARLETAGATIEAQNEAGTQCGGRRRTTSRPARSSVGQRRGEARTR